MAEEFIHAWVLGNSIESVRAFKLIRMALVGDISETYKCCASLVRFFFRRNHGESILHLVYEPGDLLGSISENDV
jgi:hypothetical protein